jgi:transcriptional regulator with XRE-family HTH domain
MLTSFGKFSRKLRIDNGELLKDMAEKLGVTSSYLSAVENGKRNVPQEWIGKIKNMYSLNLDQYKELKQGVEESQLSNKVDLKGYSKEDKNLMMALARKIDGLNEEEKTKIRNILLKK